MAIDISERGRPLHQRGHRVYLWLDKYVAINLDSCWNWDQDIPESGYCIAVLCPVGDTDRFRLFRHGNLNPEDNLTAGECIDVINETLVRRNL